MHITRSILVTLWSAEMALINRGRLSVQPVEEATFEVIKMLAEKGGWEEGSLQRSKSAKTKQAKVGKPKMQDEEGDASASQETMTMRADGEPPKAPVNKRKRKVDLVVVEDGVPLRRSTRTRK